MFRRLMAVTAGVIVATGCSWRGTPVPVAGDVAGLQGKWEGTYSSVETGRSGAILFELQAGTDSAFGDVLMTPTQTQDVRMQGAPPAVGQRQQLPTPLRISFVRAVAGRVTGRLDPYDDPTTGQKLSTTFEGRLRGNELKGTYSTWVAGSDMVVRGEWSVKRKQE